LSTGEASKLIQEQPKKTTVIQVKEEEQKTDQFRACEFSKDRPASCSRNLGFPFLKDPANNLGFFAAERLAGRPQIDETGRRQKRSSMKRGEMMEEEKKRRKRDMDGKRRCR
jgi:hypothetical protein